MSAPRVSMLSPDGRENPGGSKPAGPEPAGEEGLLLEALGRELTARASSPAHCELLGRRLHRSSVTLEVRVVTGSEVREIFVKRLRGHAGERHRETLEGRGRPRLKSVPDPTSKLAHEAAALGAIQAMVADAGPGLWFAVPVVAVLPGVLALERFDLPTLAESVRRGNHGERIRSATRELGAWLHAFHRLPDLPHTRPRLLTRDELVDVMAALLDHVDAGPISRRVSELAASLPASLPAGLSHGDFAAHNVFVGNRGEIAVFDTMAAWRSPPHFDLACFNVMLDFGDLRRLLPGLRSGRVSRDLERELLAGYGPAAPPRSERAVFEIAVLLDKWASLVTRKPDSRLRGMARRVRREVLTRRLRRAVQQRLDTVE